MKKLMPKHNIGKRIKFLSKIPELIGTVIRRSPYSKQKELSGLLSELGKSIGISEWTPKTVKGLKEHYLKYGMDSSRLLQYLDLGFDFDTFVKNVREFADYDRKTHYHGILTSDQIFKEILKAGKKESNVDVDNPIIRSFFALDVLPRYLENIKRSGIKLKEDELKYITDMISNPTKGLDIKYGYTGVGSSGYALGPSFIRFTLDYPASLETIAHELHHSLRYRLGEYLKQKGYDISDIRFWKSLQSSSIGRFRGQLNIPEYFEDELELLDRTYFRDAAKESLTPDREIGATLSELRFLLYKNYVHNFGKIPTLEEFNKHIDSIPTDILINYFKKSGYGRSLKDRATDYYRGAWDKAFDSLVWSDFSPSSLKFSRAPYDASIKDGFDTLNEEYLSLVKLYDEKLTKLLEEKNKLNSIRQQEDFPYSEYEATLEKQIQQYRNWIRLASSKAREKGEDASKLRAWLNGDSLFYGLDESSHSSDILLYIRENGEISADTAGKAELAKSLRLGIKTVAGISVPIAIGTTVVNNKHGGKLIKNGKRKKLFRRIQ